IRVDLHRPLASRIGHLDVLKASVGRSDRGVEHVGGRGLEPSDGYRESSVAQPGGQNADLLAEGCGRGLRLVFVLSAAAGAVKNADSSAIGERRLRGQNGWLAVCIERTFLRRSHVKCDAKVAEV